MKPKPKPETETEALKRCWEPFLYALRGEFGGGPGQFGDQAARRFFAWARENRLFYAEPGFLRLMLATVLDARAKPIDAEGHAIQDVVAYTFGWQRNRQANGQERRPAREFVQKAGELLRQAEGKLQKNGTRHKAFLDELVAAWTKDAKPKEAGV